MIPDEARANVPERLADELAPHEDRLPALPFGSDLTAEELTLARALKGLEQGGWPEPSALAAAVAPPAAARPYLERLGLDAARGAEERLLRRVVVFALARAGVV